MDLYCIWSFISEGRRWSNTVAYQQAPTHPTDASLLVPPSSFQEKWDTDSWRVFLRRSFPCRLTGLLRHHGSLISWIGITRQKTPSSSRSLSLVLCFIFFSFITLNLLFKLYLQPSVTPHSSSSICPASLSPIYTSVHPPPSLFLTLSSSAPPSPSPPLPRWWAINSGGSFNYSLFNNMMGGRMRLIAHPQVKIQQRHLDGSGISIDLPNRDVQGVAGRD